MITTLPLAPDNYSDELYGNCTLCGECAAKCPPAPSHWKRAKSIPCSKFLDPHEEKHSPRYGCGKCQTGVPCKRKYLDLTRDKGRKRNEGAGLPAPSFRFSVFRTGRRRPEARLRDGTGAYGIAVPRDEVLDSGEVERSSSSPCTVPRSEPFLFWSKHPVMRAPPSTKRTSTFHGEHLQGLSHIGRHVLRPASSAYLAKAWPAPLKEPFRNGPGPSLQFLRTEVVGIPRNALLERKG